MKYTYILLAEAQEEYESAFNWYTERSITAAENFIADIDYTLELICSYPNRWRNEYDDFFELGLKKYPFSIIYLIDNAHRLVIVSSIYHHSRNPKSKYRK